MKENTQNRKVLMQELAEGLSRRKGITKKDADAFLRVVFDVIEQHLMKDKLVKVKGLGTFKLVSVESRESVNVNTGERIRIEGHTKISFTPDAVLRDQVNKPFAEFETVVLHDGVDLKEMEQVEVNLTDLPDGDVPLEHSDEGEKTTVSQPMEPEEMAPLVDDLLPEEDEPITGETSAMEVSDGEPTSETEQIAAETTEDTDAATVLPEPETEEDEPNIPLVSVDILNPVPEPEPVDTAVTHEEEAPVGPADTEPNGEQPMAKPAETPTERASEPLVSAPTSETPLGVVAQTVQEQTVTDMKVDTQHVEHQTIENQNIVQQARREPSAGGIRLSNAGLVGLVLFVLLLMAGSYYVGYYQLLCPCRWETLRPTTPVKPAAPVVKARPAAPRKVVRQDTATVAQPTDTTAKAVLPAVSVPVEAQAPQAEPKRPTPAPSDSVKTSRRAPHTDALPQVDGGRYIIVGTRKEHVVAGGETLRTIALEEYGSKGYAAYIAVYNRIADPNTIQKGQLLKLPELKRRDE